MVIASGTDQEFRRAQQIVENANHDELIAV